MALILLHIWIWAIVKLLTQKNWNLECPLGFLYKDFKNNGYFISRLLDKLGQVFWQPSGHPVVQLVSNYPSNLSCLLGFLKKMIFHTLFFIVETFGQINILTILTTWWPLGPIYI
jgi:hypothetical protein